MKQSAIDLYNSGIEVRNKNNKSYESAKKKSANPLVYQRNPSLSFEDSATQDSPYNIHYVENPTEKMIDRILYMPDGILYVPQTHENCMKAVERNAGALMFIAEHTEELVLRALENDPFILQHAKIQTEAIVNKAIELQPLTLQYVWDKTDEVCKKAIE